MGARVRRGAVGRERGREVGRKASPLNPTSGLSIALKRSKP